MNSDTETQSVKAMFILEVLGKPAEHLTTTLKKLIEDIGNEKGVKVKDKKINKPQPMKDQEGFFSNFAEIELELEETFNLVGLMFKYMPAHVEILSPEKVTLTNNDFNTFLNELTRRLHGYDQVARVVQAEKKILENKLKTILTKIKEAKEKADKKKKE